MPDGSDKRIAFASTTLGSTVKKYLQTDKEAPGIVRGVKKVLYISLLEEIHPFNRSPAANIHPEIGVPVRTAARLLKYALYLSGLQYDIRIKALKKLSRKRFL